MLCMPAVLIPCIQHAVAAALAALAVDTLLTAAAAAVVAAIIQPAGPAAGEPNTADGALQVQPSKP